MVVAYHNYAEYYSVSENDPACDDYSRVLASFLTSDTRTAAELLDLSLNSVSIPQVFAVAALNSTNETRVYLLHRPQRITAPLGGTSPWDAQVFATNGEVIGNLVVTVRFPENPFQASSLVRVRTADDIGSYFEDHADALFIPPTPAGTIGAEEYTTRFVMYFPAAFITPELLNSQGTPPVGFGR